MFKRIAIAILGTIVLALPVAAQDAAPAAADTPALEEGSIWLGVSNQEQVDRGKLIYSGTCGKCHGAKGNGAGDPDQPKSPAIARAPFLAKYDYATLDGLFEYIRTTMPQDNPGSRTDQEYIDAMSYMLTLSGVPVGTAELPPDPDALAAFVITKKPE